MNQTSSMALLTEYAPIAHTTMMMGATMAKGMRSIAANSGTVLSTMISPTKLPRYMLAIRPQTNPFRSEEHTSELQSLMRITYAVFSLKKQNHTTKSHTAHS